MTDTKFRLRYYKDYVVIDPRPIKEPSIVIHSSIWFSYWYDSSWRLWFVSTDFLEGGWVFALRGPLTAVLGTLGAYSENPDIDLRNRASLFRIKPRENK